MEVAPTQAQIYQRPASQDNLTRSVSDGKTAVAGSSEKVTITPQKGTEESRLAVTTSSESYSDGLAQEEIKALQQFFSRFGDAGRFGAGYMQRDHEPTVSGTRVGSLLDVKA